MIGKKIKQMREFRGLSQQDLADLVGYKDKSSINRIENGSRDVAHSMIERFAKALDTTPSFLMGWTDDYESKTYHIKSTQQRFLMDKLETATEEDIEKLAQVWKLITDEAESNY